MESVLEHSVSEIQKVLFREIEAGEYFQESADMYQTKSGICFSTNSITGGFLVFISSPNKKLLEKFSKEQDFKQASILEEQAKMLRNRWVISDKNFR